MENKSIAERFEEIEKKILDTGLFDARTIVLAGRQLIEICKQQQELIEQQEKRIEALESYHVTYGKQ